jgi:regulator of cell morphogenesis and NO signaling
MFETTKTVREYALEIPAATRIFENLGIDYCCGGGKNLADACTAAGVSVGEVLDSLNANSESVSTSAARDWQALSQAELITHIVDKHHAFTRDELVRLEALLAKVSGVHGKTIRNSFRFRINLGSCARSSSLTC